MKETEKIGRLVQMQVYAQKGSAPKTVMEAAVTVEQGMAGDWHGSDRERQISILPAEARQQIAASGEEGFCFQKFKENLLVQGVDLSEAEEGDLLLTEEAKLQVTGIFKKCYPKLCALAAKGRECPLKQQGIFACVKKGGILRTGDVLRLIKKNKV